MRNLKYFSIAIIIIVNNIYAQQISEISKNRLLSKIENNLSYEILDSLEIYNIKEATPLLEQHYHKFSKHIQGFTIATLDELGSVNTDYYAKNYIDSIETDEKKSVNYFRNGLDYELILSFNILFKKNIFYKTEYFFYVIDKIHQYPPFQTYYHNSLITLLNANMYKSEIKPIFERMIRETSDYGVISFYLTDYYKFYPDPLFSFAKEIASTNSLAQIRWRTIKFMASRTKNQDLLKFFINRFDLEKDNLPRSALHHYILYQYPSPSNYIFLKNRTPSFSNAFKEELTLGTYQEFIYCCPGKYIASAEFIDSLISYNKQCRVLNWIKNEPVHKKYTDSLTSIKNNLFNGNIIQAKNSLLNFMQLIKQDSSAYLAPEAILFLYYPAKYAVERISTGNIPQSSIFNDIINTSYRRKFISVNSYIKKTHRLSIDYNRKINYRTRS